MVLTIDMTVYFLTTSRSFFSAKKLWSKTKILEMVEPGVLTMVHYRRGFPNPMVVPERGANLEKIQ
jgi:hypothetical protein